MTKLELEQFLLTTLAEQAGDVAKAALKAVRFGTGNHNPETGILNRADLRMQFLSLLAIADMLRDEGVELFNFASNADMSHMKYHVKQTERWIEKYVAK